MNRDAGGSLGRNAAEVAVADFLSSDERLKKLVDSGDQVVLLHEGIDLFVSRRPENLYAVSTLDFLRGLERAGMIGSAEVLAAVDTARSIIREMTHPTGANRSPEDRRDFGGAGESARFKKIWRPETWMPA